MALRPRISHSLIVLAGLALAAGPVFAAGPHRAVVSHVAPAYPELAHRMRVSGKVVLMVDVQPDGTVSNTKVESGHPLLVAAAEDAVRRWRFAPTPEASQSEVEVNFDLGN